VLRKDVAAKVRELRRARRWTQAELASRLGLSQSRLSELERGAGSFTAEQLLVLARLFNVPPSEFVPRKPADELAPLQNALVRFGASHLLEREDVTPDESLDVTRAIREALVSGVPRFITSLGPVLVRQIDRVSLTKLHATLADVGFQRRLAWLVENTVAALRSELTASLPRPWAKRYRRAILVLGTALEEADARRQGKPATDLLDPDIRSARTRRQIEASSSRISRRWGIVSALQPEDFVRALRGSRVAL
jgi:HTH-type transcriptional regulator/antitoxin HipB